MVLVRWVGGGRELSPVTRAGQNPAARAVTAFLSMSSAAGGRRVTRAIVRHAAFRKRRARPSRSLPPRRGPVIRVVVFALFHHVLR